MDNSIAFVDLKAQYASLEAEVKAAMDDVLQRGDFILGSDVRLFEQEFADYCGVKHAIGVDSGTTALELALRAYGIGTGDEVITAANTFIATTFAISYTGAQPVLVDIHPDYYTLDANAIEQAITPRTRAIIPVHLYGQPADMDAITRIAEKYGLTVIEDACQAHGARYKGRRTGSLGHAAAFSFYPGKNLGAYGDGGMVVTDDSEIAERIRSLRNYGQSAKYHHDVLGYNHRLDTLQAAVLRVKLHHLDEWNQTRRDHATQYTNVLANAPVILPKVAPYSEPVWHLYVILTEDRDELARQLGSNGISTGIHYPIPIHLQACYQGLPYPKGSFPVTEQYAQEMLSLPMFAELSEDDVSRVGHLVEEFATRQLHAATH